LALLLPLLLLPAAGCRNNSELVEAELAARERDVRELKEELQRLEWHNEALQKELSVSQHDNPRLAPEHATQIFELRRIVLGRSTAGYDQDNHLGDDALQVALEPRDGADHVIKAPGTLSVTALEVSPEGIKTPFSSWTVLPEQLRDSWKTGFFSTGYVLVLPWQTPPHCEHVRVVARLQTPDGRLFETDRDIRVVLRPEMLKPRLPAPVAPGPVGPEVPSEPLPAPRPANQPPSEGPALSGAVFHGVEPAAHWQAPPLEGAVQLERPEPLRR
jgi:hypothetical protein